jgi:hypothetical protein
MDGGSKEALQDTVVILYIPKIIELDAIYRRSFNDTLLAVDFFIKVYRVIYDLFDVGSAGGSLSFLPYACARVCVGI